MQLCGCLRPREQPADEQPLIVRGVIAAAAALAACSASCGSLSELILSVSIAEMFFVAVLTLAISTDASQLPNQIDPRNGNPNRID
jgi:hypothetical protein